MKLIDITRTVQEAPVYPGSKPIEIEKLYDMQKGDPFNVSKITAGSHLGTHADAGCHFIKDNPFGIDKMELFRYYGSCRVLTFAADSLITREALEGRIDGCERMVIRGGESAFLTRAAADYIIEKGVLTIVTDAMSIAPPDNEAEIHRAVMGTGIAVVENVILDGVEDGEYTLSAFPVKIGGGDGAPVRAVLIKDK